MPTAPIDGNDLYYEATGDGFPLVWCHEFAGSHASWEPQVRFFARHYRVITWNARGYPPSGVPETLDAYSVEHSVADLKGLLRHLGIEEAYVGGLSMGGGIALNFGLSHPEMARALVLAGTGSGTTDPELFRRETRASSQALLSAGGMEALAGYAQGPTRVQLKRKDPRGWEEFRSQLMAHSARGSALTLEGVQSRRRTIHELEDGMRALQVPTLIIVGDEDNACIGPGLLMKRTIPRSGLVLFAQSGHTVNLEEPDLFNRTVQDFLHAVETGAWATAEVGGGEGFHTGEKAPRG